MENKRKLAGSETILLKILWDAAEPLSVAQTLELLKVKEIGWAYTTVATFYKRMEKKGLVTAEKIGRSYFYTPAVKEEDITNSAVNYVSKFFKGSLKDFLSAFSGNKTLKEKDITDLKEWLDEFDD
ncbi:penicillinase repressor [Clostridiales bacterium]|nr:penicillinase repressor [Clostridiales bacterium]